MIENYQFGSITINGKTYNFDVEVRSTGEVLKWWRKEGHVIDVEDLQRAVEQNPKIIVIGTGEMGVAKVTKEAQDFIKEKGIELIIDFTQKATEVFNTKSKKKEKVIGLFHLTC